MGVGEDLDTFFHWHPTTATGSRFMVSPAVFSAAGRYIVALDGALASGEPLAEHTKVRAGMCLTTPACAVGSELNHDVLP